MLALYCKSYDNSLDDSYGLSEMENLWKQKMY